MAAQIIMYCAVSCSCGLAQKTVSPRLGLEQCIEIALKNNEGLKIAALNIEHEKQNQKNSTEIPKTNVVYTQGQFNSIYKYDENFTISQSIPFPTVFSSRHALARAQYIGSQYTYEATRAELILNIKTAYYSILFQKALYRLFLSRDSIYTAFAAEVARRFEQGKASLLEKTDAETQELEIKNLMLVCDEDIHHYYLELKTLMNSTSDFEMEQTELRKKYAVAIGDSISVTEHPVLKQWRQHIEVNKGHIALEKAKILPDLSFSYFNQTIYGPANIFGEDYFLTKKNRLQGFVIGMALPLWIFPGKSRVEAARINVNQASVTYHYEHTLLHAQYQQALAQYLKYQKSISYYEKNVMVNSQKIVDEASRAYKAGEIGYGDFAGLLNHALSNQQNYLYALHQNNLAVLKLEYLRTK